MIYNGIFHSGLQSLTQIHWEMLYSPQDRKLLDLEKKIKKSDIKYEFGKARYN